MNKTNSALELQKATTRILRWRIPLFIALIANVAILARLAVAPAGAAAGQPMATTVPVAPHSPALRPSNTTPAVQPVQSSVAPKTTTSNIAEHALPIPQVDRQTLRTPGPHMPATEKPSTSIVGPTEPALQVDLTAHPAHAAPLNVSDYMPDLSDLADRWWPALESTAEAAAQFAAAQHPQAGELAIGNYSQNGVPVSFLLDGRVYTLHPGESHLFPLGTSWNIQFHRGGALGNISEPLTPGKYQFVVGADGWTLQPAR